MELRHLRYFVTVAECGSISRAAEELFIAQPPLSVQIRQLEEHLGTRLLIRYPRGVRLTSAGERFLLEAKNILSRTERCIRMVRDTNNDEGGHLHLGFIPSIGRTMLPQLLRDLKKVRPHCDLEVTQMATDQQLHSLHGMTIDIGIVRNPFPFGNVLSKIELNDPFCLAIPEGHPLGAEKPIDLSEAAGQIFVSLTRHKGGFFFDQTIRLCADAGFSPNIRYEASTLFGVLDLVSANLGVALVPASAIMLNPQFVTFRRLHKPSLLGSLSLVYRQDDPNPVVSALVSLAIMHFKHLDEKIQNAFPDSVS